MSAVRRPGPRASFQRAGTVGQPEPRGRRAPPRSVRGERVRSPSARIRTVSAVQGPTPAARAGPHGVGRGLREVDRPVHEGSGHREHRPAPRLRHPQHLARLVGAGGRASGKRWVSRPRAPAGAPQRRDEAAGRVRAAAVTSADRGPPAAPSRPDRRSGHPPTRARRPRAARAPDRAHRPSVLGGVAPEVEQRARGSDAAASAGSARSSSTSATASPSGRAAAMIAGPSAADTATRMRRRATPRPGHRRDGEMPEEVDG